MARKVKELYEQSYKDKQHFSFGKNWQRYLKSLTPEKITEAERALSSFFGGKLRGKSFVDIGCGSGLSSLAAVRLGAKVVSVDIDDASLACTRYLKETYGGRDWKIVKASALSKSLLRLGKFDVVYSWGVLHHTGDMYAAFANVSKLVKKQGVLYLAIYNNNEHVLEGTSRFWKRVKKFYNHTNVVVKKLMHVVYAAYLFVGIAATGKNPIRYIRNYKSFRGMSFYTDVIDWLGGYPYEYASTEQIVRYFSKRGYVLKKLFAARSIGCNEFLFKKK